MIHTRIPPASTQDDRIDDFLAKTERDLFILEEAASRRVLFDGLNKRQLMEVVWTLQGRDYRIERRMGTALDDIGRDTGATYQLGDLSALSGMSTSRTAQSNRGGNPALPRSERTSARQS